MVPQILILAASIRVAIPAFNVEHAPGLLALRVPQFFATALEEAQCANAVAAESMPREISSSFDKCGDQAGCIADAGRSMGVDFVLSGTVQRTDETYTFAVAATSVKSSQTVGKKEIRYAGEANGLATGIKNNIGEICKLLNPSWAPATAEAALAQLAFDDGKAKAAGAPELDFALPDEEKKSAAAAAPASPPPPPPAAAFDFPSEAPAPPAAVKPNATPPPAAVAAAPVEPAKPVATAPAPEPAKPAVEAAAKPEVAPLPAPVAEPAKPVVAAKPEAAPLPAPIPEPAKPALAAKPEMPVAAPVPEPAKPALEAAAKPEAPAKPPEPAAAAPPPAAEPAKPAVAAVAPAPVAPAESPKPAVEAAAKPAAPPAEAPKPDAIAKAGAPATPLEAAAIAAGTPVAPAEPLTVAMPEAPKETPKAETPPPPPPAIAETPKIPEPAKPVEPPAVTPAGPSFMTTLKNVPWHYVGAGTTGALLIVAVSVGAKANSVWSGDQTVAQSGITRHSLTYAQAHQANSMAAAADVLFGLTAGVAALTGTYVYFHGGFGLQAHPMGLQVQF